MKKKYIFIITIIVSIFIVGISPAYSGTLILNQGQLANVYSGYPFQYIKQDCSAFTPPEDYFPVYMAFKSPWENPTKILWGNFFLSVLVVIIFINIFILLCYLIFNRKKMPQKRNKRK